MNEFIWTEFLRPWVLIVVALSDIISSYLQQGSMYLDQHHLYCTCNTERHAQE